MGPDLDLKLDRRPKYGSQLMVTKSTRDALSLLRDRLCSARWILKAFCVLDSASLKRAFELMEKYADHPMDLADASLIVAAEELRTFKIFTVDRDDFATYRIRRGHRYYGVDVIS